AVLSLILSLHDGGFLDPAPVDVPALLRDRLDPASPGRKKIRDFFRTLRIGWDGADRFVSACYRGGLRFAFRPLGLVAIGTIPLTGLAAFVPTASSDRVVFSTTDAPAQAVLP